MPRNTLRFVSVLTAVILAGTSAISQDAIRLVERFDPADAYRVEVKVTISGTVSVPLEKDKPPRELAVRGMGTVVFDERPLAADRVLRLYRELSLRRSVGEREQSAEIRPTVTRMVVLRSDAGKKAPFSPDGPLTWNEIDVVRADLFAPALVPGLLPAKPVRPGDQWPATTVAVTELTDLDPIQEGGLTVGFPSVVTLDGRRYAKLTVTGSVKGVSEDGPVTQRLDGISYFDLDGNRLTYLNLSGTKDLLGPDGKSAGRIEGKFVMSRKPAGRVPELTDSALRDRDLEPTPENTHLLYDNTALGVRFLYSRRWRVGTVQGRQVTLDEPKGGGILVSLEPLESLPTADQFLTETRDFLTKQKWSVTGTDAPRRWQERPAIVDRFALDAEVNRESVRLEYAVIRQTDGGATVAARLPIAQRKDLEPDVDRLLKSLTITKRIGK